MPNLHCELHHRICNLRYGTRGYGMSTYRIPSKRLNTSSEDLQGRGIGRLLRGCVPLRKQSGNPFFEIADLRPDFLNHAVCFLDITVKLAFLVKLHAVPQGRMVRERGRGMERQHDFRMDAAALAGGIIT